MCFINLSPHITTVLHELTAAQLPKKFRNQSEKLNIPFPHLQPHFVYLHHDFLFFLFYIKIKYV